MARTRHRRRRRLIGLLPLALFPAAVWTPTISNAAPAPPPPAEVPVEVATTATDLTPVPDEPVEVPASVSRPGIVVPERQRATSTVPAAGTTATNGIPSAALAAYQRAETVINASDPSCNLDWELLASVGRVESDHGRYGGNQLDANGVATPGIVGIALNGSNSTARIPDSDDGEYDNDPVWDRAVGPMQFIPTTWSVVGVDADGDSQRNPQDIDDAALGAAVYLCSGEDDLSSDAGRRSAIFRYNRSNSYVDLVLRLFASYSSGDYAAVPDTVPSGGTPSSVPVVPIRSGGGGGDQDGGGRDDEPSGPNDATSGTPGATGTSAAEAAARCSARGLVNDPLRSGDRWDRCVASSTG